MTEGIVDELSLISELPGGVDRLRELILTRAVEGRLVSRGENDIPASVSLNALGIIATESAHDGWASVTLGALGTVVSGATPSKANSAFWSGDIPWVSPKDMKQSVIHDSIDHVSSAAVELSSLKVIPKGSLLVVVRGMILVHSFPVAITAVPVTINQDIKALIVTSELSQYLLLYLQASKRTMVSAVDRSSHGTCKLLSEKLWSHRVELPPLAEQHRVVAEVHELMALCDRLEARQQDAEAAHRQLVQVLLDRLTQARDAEEFRASWERVAGQFDVLFTTEESVDKLWRAILDLAANGRLATGDPNAAQLPISELLVGDTLNGCSQKPHDTAEGIPILRISAATGSQDFIVDETDHKWVTLTEAERTKFRLEPNDLLACRFNGNLRYVGTFAIYRGVSSRELIFPDKLIRFRIDTQKASADYIRFIMNALTARSQIESFCATTVGNIGISATNLKTVRVRVPELDEQRRIVGLLTALLAVCTELKSRLAASEELHETVAEALVACALGLNA